MSLLGVKSPTTGALRVRKVHGGGILVEGDAPELHEFPRKFLVRELNDAVRIKVTIPSNPPVTYEVTGITATGDLVAHKLPTPKPTEKPKKRRWWQRKNKHG